VVRRQDCTRPVALVLSATITPPANAPALKRRDPALRLADYADAMRFYLGVSDRVVDRIVFIDNSATDLSLLKARCSDVRHAKRVEWISFQGNDHDPTLGKGYGEFRLLDHGIASSDLLRDDERFWKLTGRLIVRNMESMILSAPREGEVYCDLRDVPLVGHRLGLNYWMDLRLFAMTKRFYMKRLFGRFHELRNRGPYYGPEQFMFDLLLPIWKEELGTRAHTVSPRFSLQPVICGRNGHSNRDYRSAGYRVKEWSRAAARVVCPRLWL